MALDETLDLKGQGTEATKAQPVLDKLQALMVERQEIWQKLTDEERKKWLDSNKDPVLTQEYNHLIFLKEFFGDL